MSDLQHPQPKHGNLLSEWIDSLQHYIRMCLFSSSPANLSYNPVMILITLMVYITIGQLMLGGQRSFGSILLQIGIEVGILLLITHIALKILKKPQRLVQTMSALIGVSLCISIISLMISSSMSSGNESGQHDVQNMQINLLLLFWNLAVISLIFKRAFEIRTLLAAVIAFNYFLFYEFLLINLL